MQASENQEMSTKEDLYEKESASVEDKEKETVGFTAVPAGTVTVEEANGSAMPIRLAGDKKNFADRRFQNCLSLLLTDI